MRPLTVTQLTQHLLGAAAILRSKVDTPASVGIISGLLVLKRASDQPGILRVPECARWPHIAASSGATQAGRELRDALQELERGTLTCWTGCCRTLTFPVGSGLPTSAP